MAEFVAERRGFRIPLFQCCLSYSPRSDGRVSVPELTERLDVTKSTIARHADELEAAGAVETRTDGKRKLVEPSLGGQLALRSSNVR